MLRQFYGSVFAALIFMTGAALTAAQADLSYTLTAHIHAKHVPFGITPIVRATFYYHDMQERVDSSLIVPMMGAHSSIISDCAANKVYTQDQTTGGYVAADGSTVSPDPFGIKMMMSAFANAGTSPQTHIAPAIQQSGVVNVIVKVVDKGVLLVDNVSAHDWVISMTTSSTGNVVADVGPPDVEIWTDNTPLPISCAMQRAFNGDPASQAPQPGLIQYNFTGDIDAFRTALSYAPVRLQFLAQQQGVTINFQRSKLSNSPLESKLFQPPVTASASPVPNARGSSEGPANKSNGT